MNDLPTDWLDQLKSNYPKRSGPMSWPRVFLKVRRALMDSPWETLIEGVKRYAKYTQEAGIEGSSFVLAPARFFEDEIYLEDLQFSQPEDPKVTAHKAQELERWDRASELAKHLSVPRYPMDSIEAFESRIRLAESRPSPRPVSSTAQGELSSRISTLASRMRLAK